MRGDLRFDMAIKPGELDSLHAAERDWLPIVEAALGPGYRLIHMVRPHTHSELAAVYTPLPSHDMCLCPMQGCFISLAGSPIQTWHSDGDHVSDLCHLPPHCLNVFLPVRQSRTTRLHSSTRSFPHSELGLCFSPPKCTTHSACRACLSPSLSARSTDSKNRPNGVCASAKHRCPRHRDGRSTATMTRSATDHALARLFRLAACVFLCPPRVSAAGSHVFNDFDVPATPVALECAAGDALVFDYRIKHRGLANKNDMSRPIVYLTYAKVQHSDTTPPHSPLATLAAQQGSLRCRLYVQDRLELLDSLRFRVPLHRSATRCALHPPPSPLRLRVSPTC